MPDVMEVFDMVRNRTEPIPFAWEEQERRQRRTIRNRKTGAIALSAALVIVTSLLFLDTTRNMGRDTKTGNIGTRSSGLGVYRFDLGSSNVERIPGIALTGASGIDVSPDGSMIAYAARQPAGRQVVHIASVDGTEIRRLARTGSTADAFGPQWSPDGGQIVYQSTHGLNDVGALLLVDVATGKTTKLMEQGSQSGIWYISPTFSADGKTILLNLPRGNHVAAWDLWAIRVGGGERTLVRRNAIMGAYTPDGTMIAFIDLRRGAPDDLAGDLWLARANGSHARQLVAGDIEHARWSPDGTTIAYSGSAGTFVVDVKTGRTSQVLDATFWLEWLDDDTLILAD